MCIILGKQYVIRSIFDITVSCLNLKDWPDKQLECFKNGYIVYLKEAEFIAATGYHMSTINVYKFDTSQKTTAFDIHKVWFTSKYNHAFPISCPETEHVELIKTLKEVYDYNVTSFRKTDMTDIYFITLN